MASINYAAREISVKIVYYGPGLSGKTTNLQVIHRKVPPEYKSDMVSLATETDRTLFFDFLPLDLGKIKGFSTKFQLYTVPGQVYYNATRKLVLRGVDGVVFVADSGADKMQENFESFQNLEENLAEYGYKRETIPIIIQYNKRDLPNALPVDEINRQFNKYDLQYSEAVANKGIGVFDSLKLIGKIVIDYLNKKYSRPGRPGGSNQPLTSTQTQPPVQNPPQQFQSRQQTNQPQPPQSYQGFPPPPKQGLPNSQNTFQRPQSQQQPFQQQYPGFQKPSNIPPQPRQPQQMPPPPPIMPTPSQMQTRQVPVQPPMGFQNHPAGFSNPVPPIQQSGGGIRPSAPRPPMYQQPPQGQANQGMYQQQPPKPRGNPEYQQNFQNPGRQQPSDQFNDEATFEPQSGPPSYQPQQNAPYPNDEYFNYGNVNIGANNPQQFEQQPASYQQQHEEPFEMKQPVRGSVTPSADHTQKTDLDLEIEKYQREIEEKQRKMRVQGQIPSPQSPMPSSLPQQPIQQQRPQMPAAHQQNQHAAEQDYDVYNIELSSYPPQPPTQRQAPIQQSENDDDMYFTSVDTDRQKKPIRKPVNPRTQPQKGFLSKFFNGNNREMP